VVDDADEEDSTRGDKARREREGRVPDVDVLVNKNMTHLLDTRPFSAKPTVMWEGFMAISIGGEKLLSPRRQSVD